MIKYWRVVITTLFVMILPWQLRAELVIEVTGGTQAAMPIAIVPFASEGVLAKENISAVIGQDLLRSGRFELLSDEDLIARPHDAPQVNFKDWRLLRSEALLIGKVSSADGQTYQVQFQLFDVYQGRRLAGRHYQQIPVSGLRSIAHQIADQVYEALTGERGVFSTRLAFVKEIDSAIGKRYALQISDADGVNARTVLESGEPILSPSWAPDGQRLSYVSFENGGPEVFVQEIRSGQRNLVAAFKGINSAPAWSPDGKKLALTLSKAGNPEIYILTLSSGSLSRVTYNVHAIDTEAVWLPNGREILFTSDRGGAPQIYKTSVNGGKVTRVTFSGSYNASPDVSPDGRLMTMITRKDDGQFYIALQEIDTGRVQILTKTGYNESPSFAPNGRMILYATKQGGKDRLGVVSVDGQMHQRLDKPDDRVGEPAWSPIEK